jgi:hypothetical protein
MLGRLGWLVLMTACAGALFAGVVWLSVARPWKPHGYLGLEFAALTPAASARTPLLTQGGALVSEVRSDSAAARAGIKQGEVAAAIDGTPIASARQASDIIRGHKAGDRIQITLFDITEGEIHPHKVVLAFEADPPPARKLSVRPPRTLAREMFNLPTMAANAAWSRRIARGPTIRPVALKGLGDGHCNGFAPEEWRVAGHAPDDSMFHVMANEGFAHAIYKSAPLGRRDPESFILEFLKATFGTPAVLTPAQARPFGFVLHDFGNARGGAGFVEYRVMGARIALWIAAVPGADMSWAKAQVGAVAFSLHCAAPGAPAPLPRGSALPMTAVSTHCIDGACGEGDFAAAYLPVLRLGYVHNLAGDMFLVNPRRDFWQDGAEGPGFYHQIGGQNEKLEPGRIN